MLTKSEIQKYTKQKRWQTFRKSLKGKTLKVKLSALNAWLVYNNNSKASMVQVENYKNALKRAGYKVDSKR